MNIQLNEKYELDGVKVQLVKKDECTECIYLRYRGIAKYCFNNLLLKFNCNCGIKNNRFIKL